MSNVETFTARDRVEMEMKCVGTDRNGYEPRNICKTLLCTSSSVQPIGYGEL